MASPNQIHQIFQQYLGRDASDYELQGFADAMGKGIIDPIGLGLFLQGSSEYAQKKGPGQAAELAKGLQSLPGYDNKEAVRSAQNDAVGRMAELGRQDSSGLSAQFAQIGAKSAEDHRNATYGAAADYLTNTYNKAAGGGASAAAYTANNYNSNSLDKKRSWAVEDRNFEAAQNSKYYSMAQAQNDKNQAWQFTGGLVGAGAKVVGGGLAGGYF